MKLSLFLLSEKQAESGDRLNEDGLIVRENGNCCVAAVFDGATALSTVTGIGGMNKFSGRFASENAISCLDQHWTSIKSAKELIISANHQLHDALLQHDIDPDTTDPLTLPQTQAAIVRVNKKQHIIDVALVGDAACAIEMNDGAILVPVQPQLTPEDTEALDLAKIFAQKNQISVKEALKYEEINRILTLGRRRANQADSNGVGVIDGQTSIKQYIRTWQAPIINIKKVILLTDGLILPLERIDDEPDWQAIMKIIQEKGLEGLYKEVFKLKNSDPNLDRFPRFKKHDDATGVLIEIN